MDQQAEKFKRERVIGQGIRTRQETAKWNQNDSPEIPDRGETSDIPAGENSEQ